MYKKKEQEWMVLPHDEKLLQLEENIWTIEGTIPTIPMPRRMTVIRLRSGDLLLHNAIALSETCMTALTELGNIAWMVIPNGYHRIDAPRYKARFPDLKVICPKGAMKRVRKKITVNMDFDEADVNFRKDNTVSFNHLRGIRQMEGVLKVYSKKGLTLIMNDSIFHLEHMQGLFGLIYGRLMRHTGHVQIPNAFRWVILKDKASFKEQLLKFSEEKKIIRVIPGHGKLIEKQVCTILFELSQTI